MSLCMNQSFNLVAYTQTNLTNWQTLPTLLHDSIRNGLCNLTEIPTAIRLDDEFFLICL